MSDVGEDVNRGSIFRITRLDYRFALLLCTYILRMCLKTSESLHVFPHINFILSLIFLPG